MDDVTFKITTLAEGSIDCLNAELASVGAGVDGKELIISFRARGGTEESEAIYAIPMFQGEILLDLLRKCVVKTSDKN